MIFIEIVSTGNKVRTSKFTKRRTGKEILFP
jgi:hypothetical protein